MPWSPDNPVIGEFEDLIPQTPRRRSSVSPVSEPTPADPVSGAPANQLYNIPDGCYPDPNYLRAWRHLIPLTSPSTAVASPENVPTTPEVPHAEEEEFKAEVISVDPITMNENASGNDSILPAPHQPSLSEESPISSSPDASLSLLSTQDNSLRECF